MSTLICYLYSFLCGIRCTKDTCKKKNVYQFCFSYFQLLEVMISLYYTSPSVYLNTQQYENHF
jgi:hypothetical protein